MRGAVAQLELEESGTAPGGGSSSGIGLWPGGPPVKGFEELPAQGRQVPFWVQISPAPQVPQVPPQPSSPQVLPLHCGTHWACGWQQKKAPFCPAPCSRS